MISGALFDCRFGFINGVDIIGHHIKAGSSQANHQRFAPSATEVGILDDDGCLFVGWFPDGGAIARDGEAAGLVLVCAPRLSAAPPDLRTVSEVAVERQLPPGAPKASDVCFSDLPESNRSIQDVNGRSTQFQESIIELDDRVPIRLFHT